jgi:hypothetical protein
MDVYDEAAQRFVPIQRVLSGAAKADSDNLAEHPGVPAVLQTAKAG